MLYKSDKSTHTVPGVYMMKNTVTGNVYIGSSLEPRRRYCVHLKRLRNGSHTRLLQGDCALHGVQSFVFEVLCQCPKEALLEIEQAYQSLLKPYYNASGDALRPFLGLKHSAEKKAEWSAKRIADYASGTLKKVYGRVNSSEVMERIASSCAWYTSTPEAAAKISATMKAIGHRPSPEAIAKAGEMRMVYRRLSKDGKERIMRNDELIKFLGVHPGSVTSAIYRNKTLRGYTITTCSKPDDA